MGAPLMDRQCMRFCGGSTWSGALRRWGSIASIAPDATGEGGKADKQGQRGLYSQTCVGKW